MAVIQMPAVAAVRASVGRRATVTGATSHSFTVLGPSSVRVALLNGGLSVYTRDGGKELLVAVFPTDQVPANFIADFAVNLSRKAVR
jgi:hypothetical protein